MAYILTNGNYYIKMSETGGVVKTQDINEARIYMHIEKAKERFRRPAYGAISETSEKKNTKEVTAKEKKQLDLWKKCYAKRTAAM